MATRIVCNHTTCRHNYKSWCSKDKIELVWIPQEPKKKGDYLRPTEMACLQKEPVKSRGQ